MRLARRPTDINIGTVVRESEDNTFVECFDNAASDCRIASACRLKGVLGEAVDAFFASLERYTLADLLATRPGLVTLLPAPGARPRPEPRR